jgi:hypothetical protein
MLNKERNKMNQVELDEIIIKHKLWLKGKEDGIRANLTGKDLRGAIFNTTDLRCVNFTGTDLRGMDFTGVNFTGADFTGADLENVNFTGANLNGVNFNGANLYHANLTGVNLNGSNFIGANLTSVNLIVLQLSIWTVYIHADTMQIGCKHYSHDEWLSFDEDTIQRMYPDALSWWREYKPLIVNGIKFMKAKLSKIKTESIN